MPVRVLNFFDLVEADRRRLESISPGLEVVHLAADRLQSLVDPAAQVILASGAPPAEGTPALKWLQLASAGVDKLAGSDIWRREVTVTNARGAYAPEMAEYILTGLLHASQRVEERRTLQERREWPESLIEYECLGLRGRKLLIVGYGTVGRQTARLAVSFGMRVAAIKANPHHLADDSFGLPGFGDPEGILPERVVGIERLGEEVADADFIAMTIPLTSRTRHLVNAEVLARMRPSAWLINVARGAVIDEEALVDALRERRLAGAWLDVFETEPLPPESPLWSLPNTTITPHVSGGNQDSLGVLTQLCCENLQRYVAGQPLLNVVRPDLGY